MDAIVAMDVEYQLTDALGQLKSVSKAPQQPDDLWRGGEQEVPPSVMSQASPDQQDFEDSIRLEQRNHYKNVQCLGRFIFVIVLGMGVILMTLDYGNPLHGSNGTFLPVSHFIVLAIVCFPPLWLVWEGHSQNRQLDQGTMSTATLAKKRSIHTPKPYIAPKPLDRLPFNHPVVL